MEKRNAEQHEFSIGILSGWSISVIDCCCSTLLRRLTHDHILLLSIAQWHEPNSD